MKDRGQGMEHKRQLFQDLEQSEQLYRQMFMAHSAVMLLIEPETGAIVAANPAAANFYGYTQAALQQMTTNQLNTSPAAEVAAARHAILTGEKAHFLFQHRLASGEVRDVEVYSVPIHIGGQTLLYSIIHDITDRKQAEAALRESESRYRSLFENNHAVMLIIDPANGDIVDANPAATRYYGWTREELRQMKITHINTLPPAEVQAEMARARAEQRNHFLFKHRRADGSVRDVEVYSGPIILQNRTLLYSIIHDITDRKQIEEQAAWLASFPKLNPSPVLEIDRHGQMLFCNAAALKVLDSIGCPDALNFFVPPDIVAILQTAPSYEATSFEREIELGGRIWRETIYLTPELQTARIYAVDVTERWQAEAQSRQLAERLHILHEIDRAILSAQTPEAIAQAVLTPLKTLVACQVVRIGEIDLSRRMGREWFVLDETGFQIKPPLWNSLVGLEEVIATLEQGQVYQVPDTTAPTVPPLLQQIAHLYGQRAYLSAPLIVQGKLVGTLTMADPTPDFFHPTHSEIVREVATSLAVALQQARLFEQARADAKTKALLLDEVNHRVSNNLLQLMALLDLEQRRALEQSADLQTIFHNLHQRIRGMSTIHNLLSRVQWTSLNPRLVIAEVIQAALSSSTFHETIQVVLEAPDELPQINTKQAIAIGTIFNELTINSIKYAFKDRNHGKIHVQMTVAKPGKQPDVESPSELQIVYRDDGPGWPQEVLCAERYHTGLWLIKTTVQHTLNGTIALSNDQGAVAVLRFKV